MYVVPCLKATKEKLEVILDKTQQTADVKILNKLIRMKNCFIFSKNYYPQSLYSGVVIYRNEKTNNGYLYGTLKHLGSKR